MGSGVFGGSMGSSCTERFEGFVALHVAAVDVQ